ncbi:TolB family protein [Conexibacter arvalis]|uniref:WD40-like Beta Propeller Repeat n=1 Tax=Conexibacter arvalis TaxID=912552 RepID=A0A840IBF9_9ACTN|nr:hypothetical protein [Conexibacter arvalis]MBB4662229.1 hypothetical protein [Conexibacter arvalis]
MQQLQRALRRGALAAVLATAVAPGAASADSIVFVKDHDVWLAEPDGSAQHRVTSDGTADNPYRSPSQSDDGTIVTVRAQPNNGPLLKLRQNGEALGEIRLPPMVAGPLSPHISPDGRLVAYEEANGDPTGWLSTDVYYSRTDAYTPRATFGSPGRGARGPSWIDSGRALVGVGNLATTHAPGQPATTWWDDWDHWDRFGGGGNLEDGEYAAGTVVFARGYQQIDNQLIVYRAAGGFATLPTPICSFSDPADGPLGRHFADPTLSADGRRLWWQEGDGVWTAPLPAGDDCAEIRPRLLIPGASEPDWSPAAVNPGPRPAPREPAPGPEPDPQPVPRTGGPGRSGRSGRAGGPGRADRSGRSGRAGRPGRSGGGRPGGGSSATVRARLAATPRIGAALRGGLRLRMTTQAAGTVRATARHGGAIVARGSGRARGAGTTTVALRFTRAGRRELRAARRARLALRVSFAARGAAPATRTVAVTLRR